MAKQEPKGEIEESSRMWASASFVGVLIIIGLPLWWKTTEVYRVAIPTDKIDALDTLNYQTSARLVVVTNDDTIAAEVSGLIEKAFEDSDVIKLNISTRHLRTSVDKAANELSAIKELSDELDLDKRNVFYVVQKTDLIQPVWLGTDRVMFFKDATAASTVADALKTWVYQTSVLEGARSEVADTARQTRFPPSDGYHILLSVVQPEPASFDAKQAVEDYIGSFVDELSELHNFTLKSQFLYMLNFDFQAQEMKDTVNRHFAVRQDRLHLLLTRLEERAGGGAALPTLNLVLYTVPCDIAPVVIYSDNGKPINSPVQAFISPKWGGVVLSSPSPDCTWTPDTRMIMGTFVSQLRKLLGIADTGYITGAHLEPLRSVTPRTWEVDTLLRIRTLEQLTAAQRTLQSLAQLLGEISNIVINDDVGASVSLAVEETYRSARLLAQGELNAAATAGARAAAAAERAFTEPSLLALLYFPDDQKYAIYIPLFLPIMFPVILSLKNLILWFRGKSVYKQKTE